MKNYDFDLFLTSSGDQENIDTNEFLDAVEDTLFEEFQGDVTPGISAGAPILYCSLEPDSIEFAIDRVTKTVLRLGLHPTQLMMRLNTPESTQMVA